MKTIYLAYGSNLDMGQMATRCPKAKAIGAMLLPDWRLIFRGVADIIPAKGAFVPVGLWEITEDCEKSLDRYEGFPNLYGKQYWKKGKKTYMAYTMNRDGFAAPNPMYLAGIFQGYEDFSLDRHYLQEALAMTALYASDEGENLGYVPKRLRTQ